MFLDPHRNPHHRCLVLNVCYVHPDDIVNLVNGRFPFGNRGVYPEGVYLRINPSTTLKQMLRGGYSDAFTMIWCYCWANNIHILDFDSEGPSVPHDAKLAHDTNLQQHDELWEQVDLFPLQIPQQKIEFKPPPPVGPRLPLRKLQFLDTSPEVPAEPPTAERLQVVPPPSGHLTTEDAIFLWIIGHPQLEETAREQIIWDKNHYQMSVAHFLIRQYVSRLPHDPHCRRDVTGDCNCMKASIREYLRTLPHTESCTSHNLCTCIKSCIPAHLLR